MLRNQILTEPEDHKSSHESKLLDSKNTLLDEKNSRQVVKRLKELEALFQQIQKIPAIERAKKAKLRALVKKWRFRSALGVLRNFGRKKRFADSQEIFEKNLDDYSKDIIPDMVLLERYSKSLLRTYIITINIYGRTNSTSDYYLKVLTRLPVDIRIKLAKIHVQYSGNKVLKLYDLDAKNTDLLRRYTTEVLKRALPYVPEEFLEQCIADNDRVGLLYIIYQRLTVTIDRYHYSKEPVESLSKLIDNEYCKLTDIVQTFKMVMKDQETYLNENGWRTPTRHNILDEPEEWAADFIKERYNKYNVINFSHGGGYFHILGFLTGQEQGYRLHSERGSGIQVQAQMEEPGSSRDKYYAQKAKKYFDIPARLFASTQMRFLRNLSCEEGEADLRSELIDYIQNPLVTKFEKY